MSNGRAASVHARLLARARERGEDFNLLLTRYGLERFLYRLSVSDARDRFWLKGALLFGLWFDAPHRPTRDADFLGFGEADAAVVAQTIAGVCAIEADDAMVYDPGSIRVEEIREGAHYSGLRVSLIGLLNRARCPVQLDIGYGDSVVPGPVDTELPVLLEGMPAPRLRTYPRASVMSEKFEAIVTLGIGNTRMKDYFDLRALALEGRVDDEELAKAIAGTFGRRRTVVPDAVPIGLTDEFAADRTKQAQWNAFLARNRLEATPLADVVREIREFMERPIRLARVLKAMP